MFARQSCRAKSYGRNESSCRNEFRPTTKSIVNVGWRCPATNHIVEIKRLVEINHFRNKSLSRQVSTYSLTLSIVYYPKHGFFQCRVVGVGSTCGTK